MQALELYAARSLRVVERERETLPAGCVRVRVDAVGVCGSDMHQFSEGHVGDSYALYPMVLGHEPAGTVLAAGAGVTGWTPGDRVALEAPIYCYHCEYCMTGRHNMCEQVRFLSSPAEPGFFRDEVVLPVQNLLPLPVGMGMAVATLHEPIAIILHAMTFAKPALGETAVIFGAGPIGLTALGVLKLSGVARVWMVEPVPHRRALAHDLGADAVLDPGAVDVVREIWRESGQRGADIVLDCATRGDTINQSLHLARPTGRVGIIGVPEVIRPEIEFHILRKRELTFFATRRYNDTAPAALRLLTEHTAQFAPMLTHERSLATGQQTFEMVETYADGVGKAVITPSAG